MVRRYVFALFCAGVLAAAVPSSGRAQSPQDRVAGPVTLRFSPSLAPMAEAVVHGTARRTGRRVVAGDPLPSETPLDPPPALGPEVLGVASDDARIVVFGTAPSGVGHLTAIGAVPDEAATARAIVLATSTLLEALALDVAPPAPTPGPPSVVETSLLPLDGSALSDLADPRAHDDLSPRFVSSVRERAGYATQRDRGLALVGLTTGACFGAWWCAVIDVDALAPEEDRGIGTSTLSYQSTTIGAGGRFLPLEAGPVRGGVGLDALVRVGQVWLDDAARTWVTTASAGMRMQLEVGIALAEVASLGLEAGADVAFNAIRFRRATTADVFTEDIVTLWAGISLRIGPL